MSRALLSVAVRLLPERRREWGRAMLAELAALETGRLRFALGCTQAVLVRRETLIRLGAWLLVAGIAGLATVLLADIRAGSVRREAIAMVVVVAAAGWLPRRGVGPLAVVVAAGALIFLHGLEPAADAGTQIAVWTAVLSIYAVALGGVAARGAGAGAVAAALWLAAVAVDPAVPVSTGPAILALGAAAVYGERRYDRTAGLRAGATAALLIAITIDGPLPLFSRWVPTSAPPVFPPHAPERLVDSVGVWLLGAALAAALAVAHAKATRSSLTPGLPGG